MASIVVESFAGGVDRTRPRYVGLPGTAFDLVNAHITRGGDVEKRKAFVPFATLPEGTFSLAKTPLGLYVFGSIDPPTMPAGILYQWLRHPHAPDTAMTAILSWDLYNGRIYAIAQYANGDIFHFYDGLVVSDWDVPVAVRPMVDNDDIALELALKTLLDPMYRTTLSGNVITITGRLANDAPFTITSSTTNRAGGVDDQVAVVDTPQAYSSGTPQISTVSIGGTFESGDFFDIVIDGKHFSTTVVATGGKPTGKGSIVRTHKRKVYSPIVSLLWFSALDSPTVFDTNASGSGFINMSTHESGSDLITALGPYQKYLAVYTRRTIQIWDMQDDDALNAPVQTLNETGTRSPRSVIGFGDIDSFYLSPSGVRSLRARNFANVAGVNDVGTPIDTLIQAYVASLPAEYVENAVAIVQPLDGRYWLALGERIFVFSYFPSKKISAWSWYEPEIWITDMVTVDDHIYARAGDIVYLYGGADNDAYGEYPVTVGLPFLTGDKPATFKNFKGFDIAATGEWACRMLVNPNNEAEYVNIGTLEGVTFPEEGIGVPGHCTHFAPVLTNLSEGYASLSQIAIETDGAEAKP